MTTCTPQARVAITSLGVSAPDRTTTPVSSMAAASFGSVPGLTRNSRPGLDRFRRLGGVEDRAGAQVDAVAVLGPDLADDRRRIRACCR